MERGVKYGCQEKIFRSQVWQGCRKDGRERDASKEERHAQVGQRRKRRHGKESQTGNSHRPFRSATKRREGSQEKSSLSDVWIIPCYVTRLRIQDRRDVAGDC